MNLSGLGIEDNMDVANRILAGFNKSLLKISCFNLGYRISKFFGKDLELFAYNKSKKDFVFYKDKTGVDNHISVYKAVDRDDGNSGVVVEIIIGKSAKKDIMFVSEDKIYNIVENKWGKVVESSIINDHKRVYDILNFIEKDINYIATKTIKYQNQLRQKGILNKQIRQSQIEQFQVNFREKTLHLA